MSMQIFYRRLAIKPSQAHRRRLAGLTRVSRIQVLNARAMLSGTSGERKHPASDP